MSEIVSNRWFRYWGQASAVMIPNIMDFNMRADPCKYSRIAGLMGETVDDLQPEYAARKAIDSFKNLLTDLNMLYRQEAIVK